MEEVGGFKIIFLDIDGVLNVYPQGSDDFGSKFHKEFEANLGDIINTTGAKIVITSTWRGDGLDVMQKMWKHRDIPGDVIGVTPYCEGVRGDEIEKWMELYSKFVDTTETHPLWENFQSPIENYGKILNYVIIDDDDDMLEHQMDNFVKTSDNFDHIDRVDIGYGLTKICSEQAIKILQNEN